MQGGCPCENACYLRIGAGNIDFTALAAPRPLGLSAANDWTVHLEREGLPELKQLYALYGADEKVEGKYFDFEHNYNAVSRAMMYAFFDKHLRLGHPEIVEQEYQPLTRSEMTVWGPDHPKPPCGEAAEVEAIAAFNQARNQQIERLTPNDHKSLGRYREIVGGALQTMVGRPITERESIERLPLSKVDRGDFLRESLLVSTPEYGEEIPATHFIPAHTQRFAPRPIIWLTNTGRMAIESPDGVPLAPFAQLLRRGFPLVGADLLYQGDFLKDTKRLTKAPIVPHVRYALGYTFGYNHPLFIRRVHDVLSLCKAFDRGQGVHLVGIGREAGPIVAAAAAACTSGQDSTLIDRVAIFTAGFRFTEVTRFDDPMMLPGAVRYGDVPFLLALNAPRTMWLGGEGNQLPERVRRCYTSAGARAPELFIGTEPGASAAAARWIVG